MPCPRAAYALLPSTAGCYTADDAVLHPAPGA